MRAGEAVVSHDLLARLMVVQRERFAEASRPVIQAPEAVDAGPFSEHEWARRKGEVRFWQRARRKQLRAEVSERARARAAESLARAQAEQQKQQAGADAWWTALAHGETRVLTAALKAAFADNPAPVVVVDASGADAVLAITLPGPRVLPKKKAHITPTGRLSSKAWTKTELNEVYAELLAAHLLATIRETWAVAPSLQNLRVVGLRKGAEVHVEALFDVDVSRGGGQWGDDGWGDIVLEQARWGLNRTGRTQEVRPWPRGKLRPDVPGLPAST
jgi:hypothetical protein